jgi:phage tail sheath protein FI
MPNYTTLAPGVYIEEVLVTPAISGVSTSTAAFLGVVTNAVEMPLLPGSETARYKLAARGVWTLLTSFAQFERSFGKAGPGNLMLALSAKGFFANGGAQLYVARIDTASNNGDWATVSDTPNPAFVVPTIPVVTDQALTTAISDATTAEATATDADIKAAATDVIAKATLSQTKANDATTGQPDALKVIAAREALDLAAEAVTAAAKAAKLAGKPNVTNPNKDAAAKATDLAGQALAFANASYETANDSQGAIALGLDAQVQAALTGLEKHVDVSIVAAPGALKDTIQKSLIDFGAANNCFAVLDGKHTTTVSLTTIQVVTDASDYAGLYYPWIKVVDPAQTFPDGTIFLPPSGLMAGVFARVDSAVGVHKAPANVGIAGALKLSYEASQNEQSVVNKEGVNLIRSFNGNIKVWGARTRLGEADAGIDYVSVRRMMIYLSKSLELGTQWVVFEPNAYPTWQKVVRSVDAFLTRVWRDGALFGLKPEQAFYVRCDETTNPPENRDVGILTVEIGVAIVRPAEFVVIRISQAAELPTS